MLQRADNILINYVRYKHLGENCNYKSRLLTFFFSNYYLQSEIFKRKCIVTQASIIVGINMQVTCTIIYGGDLVISFVITSILVG
jgi:hypothetical protein